MVGTPVWTCAIVLIIGWNEISGVQKGLGTLQVSQNFSTPPLSFCAGFAYVGGSPLSFALEVV